MPFSKIMCFGSSNSKDKDDPDARRNKEIEKQLRDDQRKLAKEVKLLLLGMMQRTRILRRAYS